MLSKKNRITRKDFPSHNRQGFRIFSPLFSGTIYQNKDGIKVSVVVSKKTAKTAVGRNYLRRIFYEAISSYIKDFSKASLVVFYPKIEAQKAKFSELKIEIEKTLRQAKVIKQTNKGDNTLDKYVVIAEGPSFTKNKHA